MSGLTKGRWLIGAVSAIAALSVLPAVPADAAKSNRARAKGYAATQANKTYAPQFYTAPAHNSSADSSDAIRARSRDPAGNYKDYPDWARAALAPPLRGGR